MSTFGFKKKVALFTYSFEPKEDLKLDVSKKVTYIPRALITCFSDKANGLRRNWSITVKR